jgi:protein-disulfide isomerase
VTRNQLVISLVAAAIVVVAVIAYFVIFPASTDSAAVPASGERAGVVLTASDRTLGSPKAPILIVEYAAPSCPICARFNSEVFPLLRQNYIDTGKVYYVFRVFPIRAADGAAEAMARCLPADNYFQFIDLLFRNQPKWDEEYGVTDVHGALVQMGRIAGMSADKIDQCISDKTEAERINKVAMDGETKYNITGTPTFVINGEPQTSGAIPWTTLQDKLNTILSKK